MKTLMIVWGLTCGGDALTTHHILSTGGREVWLPTQNPMAAATVAGGTCAIGMPTTYKLSKTHPRAAQIVGWSVVALRGSIVAHNMNAIRTHP